VKKFFIYFRQFKLSAAIAADNNRRFDTWGHCKMQQFLQSGKNWKQSLQILIEIVIEQLVWSAVAQIESKITAAIYLTRISWGFFSARNDRIKSQQLFYKNFGHNFKEVS
jgi:hypothetical protein